MDPASIYLSSSFIFWQTMHRERVAASHGLKSTLYFHVFICIWSREVKIQSQVVMTRICNILWKTEMCSCFNPLMKSWPVKSQNRICQNLWHFKHDSHIVSAPSLCSEWIFKCNAVEYEQEMSLVYRFSNPSLTALFSLFSLSSATPRSNIYIILLGAFLSP